jgi:CRP-like cAMP-binding protein
MFKQPECDTCGSRLSTCLMELTPGQVSEVAQSKHSQLYSRGSYVYAEGQYPRGIYCIHKGHVKLTKSGHDDREHIVCFAGSGDVVGYSSLLSAEKYHGSCIAVQDSSICFIPSEIFFRNVRENPSMALHVMQKLSSEVRTSRQRMVELTHKSIRERVAEALLIIKEAFGVDNDGITLRSPLTREEIAAIVGTAPESVIRTLSEFKADNLIATNGRTIKLLNVRALMHVANIYN